MVWDMGWLAGKMMMARMELKMMMIRPVIRKVGGCACKNNWMG
jgi:hypothetical protein